MATRVVLFCVDCAMAAAVGEKARVRRAGQLRSFRSRGLSSNPGIAGALVAREGVHQVVSSTHLKSQVTPEGVPRLLPIEHSRSSSTFTNGGSGGQS